MIDKGCKLRPITAGHLLPSAAANIRTQNMCRRGYCFNRAEQLFRSLNILLQVLLAPVRVEKLVIACKQCKV